MGDQQPSVSSGYTGSEQSSDLQWQRKPNDNRNDGDGVELIEVAEIVPVCEPAYNESDTENHEIESWQHDYTPPEGYSDESKEKQQSQDQDTQTLENMRPESSDSITDTDDCCCHKYFCCCCVIM